MKKIDQVMQFGQAQTQPVNASYFEELLSDSWQWFCIPSWMPLTVWLKSYKVSCLVAHLIEEVFSLLQDVLQLGEFQEIAIQPLNVRIALPQLILHLSQFLL